MLDPKDMTSFQKIYFGLQIFHTYLSKACPGKVDAEHDIIYVNGVHKNALGGDDLAKLQAMGWEWNTDHDCWEHLT